MIRNRLGFGPHFWVNLFRKHFGYLNVKVLHHLHVKIEHSLWEKLALCVHTEETSKQFDAAVLLLVSIDASNTLLHILGCYLFKTVLLEVGVPDKLRERDFRFDPDRVIDQLSNKLTGLGKVERLRTTRVLHPLDKYLDLGQHSFEARVLQKFWVSVAIFNFLQLLVGLQFAQKHYVLIFCFLQLVKVVLNKLFTCLCVGVQKLLFFHFFGYFNQVLASDSIGTQPIAGSFYLLFLLDNLVRQSHSFSLDLTHV